MGSETTYDVFLSYNSLDREHVLRIAKELKDRGCSSFLDQWYLKPGRDWVDALERALADSKSVAVFLGPHEMGRWQQRERAWALDRFAEHDDFPVVPVLLPGCEPPLGFMKQLMWIDVRNDPTSARQMDALATAIRGEPVDPDGRPQPQAMICPYRGLLAFREEDADFFFGRDKYLKQLIGLVERQTLVAVVGASGSGKSSLVSAGLVPQIRKHGDGPVWDVVRMVPNVDPLYSLAEALVPLIEPDLSRLALERELNAVANDLEQENPKMRLWGLVNAVLRRQPGTERLLLFVDQWEELYTNCEKSERRERFIAELLEATARKDSPLSVILTVRSDFYGEIMQDRPLLDRLQDAELKLGPMNTDELRSVIEGPAENVGLTFQDGLVDRILKEAGEEPGRLPLLEFALEELWKRRHGVQLTHKGYEDLGRQPGQKAAEVEAGKSNCLSRAIATYAESVYGGLSADEQAALPGLFRKLVRAGAKTEDDTRRRAALSELDETTGRVVRELADKRLLITTQAAVGQIASEQQDFDVEDDSTNKDQPYGGREASTTVEVAHEELLRRWGRLQQWVNEDRQFLLWRSRLDLKVEEHQRDGDAALLKGRPLQESRKFYPARSTELEESERRFLDASSNASRRRKLFVWGGVCAALILVAIVGVSWYRYDRRQRAENLVEDLLESRGTGFEFYLEQLEPDAGLAIPKLEIAFDDALRPPLQRYHAANALVSFDAGRPDALQFLLDVIPTLPKDESVNLIDALAKAHKRQHLDGKLGHRVDNANSALDEHRYLTVSLCLEITDRAQSICRLQEDPSDRTALIHGLLKDFPGDLARVAQKIENADPDVRSALCVAIGTLGSDAAEATGEMLKRMYVNAKDGGTHSAAGWALLQQGVEQKELDKLAKTASPDATHGHDWYVNGQGMTMVKIPAGTFEMGSPDDEQGHSFDEVLHSVELSPFWMGSREVTVEQFLQFVEGADYTGARPVEWSGYDEEVSFSGQHPIQQVSWFDAVRYCNWLTAKTNESLSDEKKLKPYYDEEKWEPVPNANGYRLPTESEWEYACRALSKTQFYYGDEPDFRSLALLPSYAVFDKSKAGVCGSKLPNGWGLFDMHGNVQEWCYDWYDGNYYQEFSSTAAKDPTGPDEGESRVVRGGSFNYSYPLNLRSAYRSRLSPDFRNDIIGFRLSRTP